MGPFDAATVRRFVTLGQWKSAARKAKDEPTAEIASGVTLGEAVIVLPGRINARKMANLEQRTAEFVLSGGQRDRDGDQVTPTGWVLQNYRKNPVVLFGHDYYNLPVGRSRSIGNDGDELVATAEFVPPDLYAFADTVFRMILGKWLNAASVGFQPLQWLWNDEERGYDFAKQELYEWSVVPVPSYPDALQRAADSGIDLTPLKGWAEATLDKIAGLPGLWLPRGEVEGMLKSLKGNPVLVQVLKAVPALAAVKQGDGGVSGDDPTAVVPDPNALPATGNGSTAGVVCPKCGTVNATDAAQCTKCGASLKGAKAVRTRGTEEGDPSESAPQGSGPGAASGSEVVAAEGDEWTCSACGTVNPAANEKCSKCGKEREAKAAPGAVTKGVVPANVSIEKADEGASWSAPALKDFTDKSWADLSADERKHIAGHYAWAKSMPPAAFGDLKLPHHQAKDGKVVWRGVASAMGRLGSAEIGDDTDKVYAHLAAHYKAFGKEPPEKAALAQLTKLVKDGGKPCPTCGAMNPMDADRCAVCGNPMQITPATPEPSAFDSTNNAIAAAVAKALAPVVAQLGALEAKLAPAAPPTQAEKDAAAIDRLLAEINGAAAPTVEQFDVTVDEVKAAVRAAVERATADAIKAKQTAVTGRLVD